MDGNVKKSVDTAFAENSEWVTLQDLVKKGQRQLRVIPRAKVVQEIENILDQALAKSAPDISADGRAEISRKVQERLKEASKAQARSETALRQQTERISTQASRLDDLASHLGDLDSFVRTGLGEIRAMLEAALDGSPQESRLRGAIDAAVESIRGPILAAIHGSSDTPIEATKVVVSKVFDDDGTLESNIDDLAVETSRPKQSISGDLEKLRSLRRRMGGGGDGGGDTEKDKGTTR